MNVLYQILILLSCLLIGYLFGSISNGIIIGKVFYHQDPRDYGSHNSGGTNVGRVFGLKTGLICIVLDILKTILPIWLCFFILKDTCLNQFSLEEVGYLLTAFGSILGHCFPCWYHFKGGKAVSSFGGVVLATSWSLALFGIMLFIILVITFKKISVASIFGSFITALVSFLFAIPHCPTWLMDVGMIYSLSYSFSLIIFSLILIMRHKPNIIRLLNGTESNFKFKK